MYCNVLYCTVLYCIVLYFSVLYCIVLHCTALYCIVLYCTVLYCIVLYCTIVYCINVLYCMYYIVMYLLSEERLYFSVISCSFKELFSVHKIKKFSTKKSHIFLTDISIFLHDDLIFRPSRLSLKVTKMYSILFLFQNLHFAFLRCGYWVINSFIKKIMINWKLWNCGYQGQCLISSFINLQINLI